MAAASTGLLVVGVWQGWLGPDVGRGAVFCEARDGLVRQPANALSNAGFVVAGLLIAARATRPELLGDRLPRYRGLTTALACLVVLLGPGSAAMHATQSSLGGELDTLSMYLVASFAAAYAAMRRLGLGPAAGTAVFVALVAACEAAARWPGEIPVVMYAGNLAFATLLVTAIGLEVTVVRARRSTLRVRYGVAAVATMAVAFAVWNLARHGWCDATSWLQGHALWHLLGAVAAYLLFRYYASERDVADPVGAAVVVDRARDH